MMTHDAAPYGAPILPTACSTNIPPLTGLGPANQNRGGDVSSDETSLLRRRIGIARLTPAGLEQWLSLLREFMDIGFAQARGLGINGGQRVAVGKTGAARGTAHGVPQIAADIIVGYGGVGILFVFHGPKLNRAVDVLEVAEAAYLVGLG